MLHDHDRETCCALPDEARLAASLAYGRGDFIGQLLATGRLLRFRLQAEIDACPDCQGGGESPLGETCEGCRTLRADLYEYDDAVWRWRTRDEKSLRELEAKKATAAAATATTTTGPRPDCECCHGTGFLTGQPETPCPGGRLMLFCRGESPA